MKKLPAVQEFIDGILKQDIALLSRAITLVESTVAEHQQLARQIIEGVIAHSGKSIRIGITGVPGVGKSSFIESFGLHVVGQQHKLAVLAIDPSSQISKGSILGDKTRMEQLSVHPRAFIRPTPSSGSLGGVARKTQETIMLCEAAGYNYILIETVGVGQSETTVHQLTDFFLLLMLTGAGDELQGIKRGIMEMADALVITKADGSNIDKAKAARAEFAMALHLFPAAESGWVPEVKTCSSLTNEGIAEVYEMIEKYRRHSAINRYFEKKRTDQARYNLQQLIDEQIRAKFYNTPGISEKIKSLEQLILQNKMSPYTAVEHLFVQ